jgi:hypothetical protein
MKNINKLNNRGVAHVGLMLAGLIVVGVLGFAAYRVFGNSQDSQSNQQTSKSSTNKNEASAEDISWMYDGNKWSPSEKPPTCKEPVVFTTIPVEQKRIEGILYPGQTRGGNYKPHGGFRLNTPTNNAEVKAIMDGEIVSGARYIEMGEVQYMFTIENDCGIAYRYDHLLKLSPKFKEVAETLPEPKVDDSRTTKFQNPVKVNAGDVVATAVGFKNNSNIGFDLGIYDYRQPNDAAKSGKLNGIDLPDLSQAGYALCWLDMFEGANFKSLPAADFQSGKTSDYCK